MIPFLGWVVGVVLLWISRLWTTRDKLIGTLGGLSMAEATSTPCPPPAPTPRWAPPPRARLLGRERPW